MAKLKTKRAAAKRFKKTANGGLKRSKAYKSQIGRASCRERVYLCV